MEEGEGEKWEGREGRREVEGGRGGSWKEVEEGCGGRGRTESHSYKRGEALADMLSVSGKGRRREGREVEGGWREGGRGMWR